MNDYCVVVSGLPASGKSTVGAEIARILGVAMLDKDAFLEELFVESGTGDADWRQRLSQESNQRFEKAARAHDSAVLVSHWRPLDQPGASGTPTEWLASTFRSIVELYCECPVNVAANRFKARERHPGHLDHTRDHCDVTQWLDVYNAHLPLGVGRLVQVWALGTIETQRVVDEIRDVLRSYA